jgi:hypothetical protein
VPKILAVLESGCHKGQINPNHVYPNVLPLVSQLVPKIVSASKDDTDADDKLTSFYLKLLSAVYDGLQHFLSLAPKLTGQQLLRKGGTTGSAKLAAEAYFDCVLFSVTSYRRQKVDEVVGKKVIDWTSDVLKIGENELESEILFHSLSKFVWMMEKKFGNDVSADVSPEAVEFYAGLLQKLSSLALEMYSTGRLASASQFLTSLIGNGSPMQVDKKEKKGGLKFFDESEKSDRKLYLTNFFHRDVISRRISSPDVSFEKLPTIFQKTVVEVASKSVQVSTLNNFIFLRH